MHFACSTSRPTLTPHHLPSRSSPRTLDGRPKKWSARLRCPSRRSSTACRAWTHLRAIPLFGLTDIKYFFKYDKDYSFDRQEVLNRLQGTQLPTGAQTHVCPWSA